MRILLSCVTAAIALAPAAASQAADKASGEAIFNNTVVSTYPDGRQAELWLNRDGSYRAEGRRHDHSDGHWKMSGAKLCLKQSHPFPAPFSFCTPTHDGVAVGSTWTGKAYTGEMVQIKIAPGRPDERASNDVQPGH